MVHWYYNYIMGPLWHFVMIKHLRHVSVDLEELVYSLGASALNLSLRPTSAARCQLSYPPPLKSFLWPSDKELNVQWAMGDT